MKLFELELLIQEGVKNIKALKAMHTLPFSVLARLTRVLFIVIGGKVCRCHYPCELRGVFRTLSDIYDEVFFTKITEYVIV